MGVCSGTIARGAPVHVDISFKTIGIQQSTGMGRSGSSSLKVATVAAQRVADPTPAFFPGKEGALLFPRWFAAPFTIMGGANASRLVCPKCAHGGAI